MDRGQLLKGWSIARILERYMIGFILQFHCSSPAMAMYILNDLVIAPVCWFELFN